MRYGILGHLEVRDGKGTVSIAQGRARLLLAVLLVNADAPVSNDRLIDALWGERPPPTASRSLHNLVSSLRKSLSDGRLVTHPRGGYELRLDGDELDAARFDALSGRGREALAAGDARASARLLREALALWRGPAFGELAYEPALQAEVARLEELRLVAVEDCVDADLALGRHGELVAELEALIVEHPLRERLRGQLMLALYRSGRQADALRAYADARRHLVDELGIEPGPALRDLERAVLEQDPALRLQEAILHRDPSLDTIAGAPRRRRPRHPRAVALLGTAVLAVAIAGAVGLANRDTAAEAVNVPPDSVAVIDAGTNAVVDAIAVDDAPGPVATGAGFVWVLNLHSETVSRIDVRSRRVAGTQGIGAAAGNVAASPEEVWIATGCVAGGDPGALVHVYSGRAGGVDTLGGDTVALDDVTPRQRGTSPVVAPVCGLAADGRSAYIATNLPPGLVRADYDPVAEGTRAVWARTLARAPTAIAVGSGFVWAADRSRNVIHRIDARSGRVSGELRVGDTPVAVATADDAVWVANEGDDSVSRIDLRTNTVSRPVAVGEGPAAIAIGGGAVWVANAGDGSVSRIDQVTHRVTATIEVGHRPQGVAVAGGSVWVTVRT